MIISYVRNGKEVGWKKKYRLYYLLNLIFRNFLATETCHKLEDTAGNKSLPFWWSNPCDEILLFIFLFRNSDQLRLYFQASYSPIIIKNLYSLMFY